ncbi:MAG: glycoside hydrolase family 65 protein [Streptococcaceae bacterium]|jgi:trehalose 6-phosphate phosphorylase|nr:glycoside hydrolase family 65 protein [Streptococcaceae bacterium]
MTSLDWTIAYDKLEYGKRSYGQESLMTLGNGYIGWRGAPVWSQFSEDHYPGLYVAGVFNRTTTEVAGHDVENEDMVNLPNPQLMRFSINGETVKFDKESIVDRKSYIDFEHGSQFDKYTVKVADGFVSLTTNKFVDPFNFHAFGFEGTFSASFDGKLVIESLIDGSVLNQNVERYRAFDSKEFNVTEVSDHLLVAKTRTTDIEIAVSAKTFVNNKLMSSTDSQNPEQFLERGEYDFKANEAINFDKVIFVATSYEVENPAQVASEGVASLPLSSIKENSNKYWAEVWSDGDIKLESEDADMQRMIRMNIFHIRQAAQHNANQYLDASVGSRGLTGEGYRGHIFWDELFVVPYYAANTPEAARDTLRYRIKRIQAAKENAIVDGEKGAMFPWQSGLDGDEQSQFVHLNTVNNEWEPDNSRRQRHVSLAIAYDLWIYEQLTGDVSLLNEGGLELLFETTKFWLNKAELGEDGRYHIAGVMGPDEYHEAYPGEEGGITDNAYTNLMLAWSLNWLFTLPSVKGLDLLEVAKKTGFDDEYFRKAQDVAKKLYLDINEDGVIAQYAKYFDLKEVDFKAYEDKYGDIHRIDRLMKAEGISPDEYKVAKQADTLMTIYNLGADHMQKLVEQLGYKLPENWLQVNHDYYLARTVHGSTTSRPVFAGIQVKLGDFKTALEGLTTAIGSDYYDIQGGTTAEGVHIGVMGETLEVIQNEFAGVTLRDGEISISPKLPASWHHLSFTQKFRGTKIKVEISDQLIMLTADQDTTVKVYGVEAKLNAGTLSTFGLQK